jgi:centrosomal protein CEP57
VLYLDNQHNSSYAINNSIFFPTLAVMAALRSLQDKIYKLELERVQAEDNLKSLASEATAFKYRDVLNKSTETPQFPEHSKVHFNDSHFHHNDIAGLHGITHVTGMVGFEAY